jgi:hypothetical protein
MNSQRKFNPGTKLGTYVYILRDPRDRKVFYVGQGTGDRLFSHFNDADSAINNGLTLKDIDSKTIRIIDIWKNDEDVEWVIIAHDLSNSNTSKKVSDIAEAVVFDALYESQNGATLNINTPPNSSSLSPDQLLAMSAPFVNPRVSIPAVFIFPIQNALVKGATPYDATRYAWNVTLPYKSMKPAFAVGLENSISVGSFEIDSWSNVIVNGQTKQEFKAPNHPNPSDYQPLLNQNWNKVIAIAKGFWQRGNYLVAEFDGKGKFRILRGSSDKTWHNCI